MNPHIFYWKWCDEDLNADVMRKRTMDIINNTNFDLIYIAFHSTEVGMLNLSPENLAVLKECNKIFNDHGRRVFVDINNKKGLKPEYGEMAVLKRFVAKLDGEGNLTADAENFTEVLTCHVVDMIDNKTFKNKTDAAFTAEVSDGKVTIRTGAENANRDVLYFLSRYHGTLGYVGNHNTPQKIGHDYFGDCYEKVLTQIMENLKDIPLGGIASDEMGMGFANGLSWYWTDGKPGESIDMLDVERYTFRIDQIPYSENMEIQYKYNYGEGLADNLIYFWNTEEGNKGQSIKVVNQYFDNIRRGFAKNEAALYDLTKKYFGEDAFVGVHSTMMGDKLDNNSEKMHNGISWWDTKRDYAQTDELVPIPTRLGIARNCPKNVWYNMWYSMRTMDIRTYFTETYTNVIYGGRTHHLGYKCYEPGVVLCIDTPEMMNALRDMEDKVAVLDTLQLSRPDARVLVTYSYAASVNHHISDPEVDYAARRARLNHDILKTTEELFQYPYLCELAPSTEIDAGKITYKNGKVYYGGHSYDAIVMLHPDGVSNKTYEWLKNIDKTGGKLIVCGQDVNYFFNGSQLSEENRYHFTNYMKETSAEKIAKLLLSWGIKQNRGENYCIFEDGSVTITNMGNKSVGNGVTCKDYGIDEPEADIVFIDKDGKKHVI